MSKAIMVIWFLFAFIGLVMTLAFSQEIITALIQKKKMPKIAIICCSLLVLLGICMLVLGGIYGFQQYRNLAKATVPSLSNSLYQIDAQPVGSGIVICKPDPDIKFGFGVVRVDRANCPTYLGDWSVLMRQVTQGQRVQVEFQCAKRNGIPAASGFVALPATVTDSLK